MIMTNTWEVERTLNKTERGTQALSLRTQASQCRIQYQLIVHSTAATRPTQSANLAGVERVSCARFLWNVRSLKKKCLESLIQTC